MKIPNARQLQGGLGDPLSKAFELVLSPAIMGFLGFLLDRWLDTLPIFTLVLSTFTLSYLVWKLYTEYSSEMDRQDEGKPWTRDARRKQAAHG